MSNNTIKILIAGDFCPQYRVTEKIEKGDYASVLGQCKLFFDNVDYSIVNLECPVCYGNEQPINKFGPNLSCSEKGVRALQWLGVKCVALANNHFLDFGAEGVENTLETCKKYKIDRVGGGKNIKEASQTLYKTIGNKRIAIINCCEHEFSIATEVTAGSNPLNPIQQYYAIQEAKKKSDYVLVITHGGHEYYQLPSIRMQETYRFFVDAGANIVVNHHQHCYGGYELYKGAPIFYGLGNFCFDEKGTINSTWNEGYFVVLNLNEKLSFEIVPYSQCSETASVDILSKDSFNNTIYELNQIISQPEKLQRNLDNYYKKSLSEYIDIFEPIRNRYYLGCKHRGWLPSFISQRKKLIATNYICCESHRDKMIYWMNNIK